MSLAERKSAQNSKQNYQDEVEDLSFGGKAITFSMKSRKFSLNYQKINFFFVESKGEQRKSEKEERQRQHIEERKNVRRSAGSIMRFAKPIPSTVLGSGRTRGKYKRPRH